MIIYLERRSISLFPYTNWTYLQGHAPAAVLSMEICPIRVWKQRYLMLVKNTTFSTFVSDKNKRKTKDLLYFFARNGNTKVSFSKAFIVRCL